MFRWRRQYQEGLFGTVSQSATLLPVQVIEAPIDLPHVVQPQAEALENDDRQAASYAVRSQLRATGRDDRSTSVEP
ncbi:hypothetical protein [Pseudomonas sp. MYb193]|uniref:hypothetical protein n=1 Tax=Pseudomonas TaxID=286 RepID=UPI003531C735